MYCNSNSNSNTTSKVLPIKWPAPLVSYPSYANLTSIILNNDSSYDWLYNNFIQLQVRKKNGIDNKLEFGSRFHRICPWIFYQRVSRVLVDKISGSIVQFCIDCINLGYYLYFLVDRHYISAYAAYQKKHIIHDLFVYGYDMEKKIFYIADNFSNGIYRHSTAPFSEVEEGFMKIDETKSSDWIDGIEILSLNEKCNYKFDINLTVDYLNDYLNSRNTVEKYCHPSEQGRKVWKYGMDTYDYLIDFINGLINERIQYEIRSFHVFYEHKAVMSDRIKFLERKGYIKNPEQSLAKYSELQELSLGLRNLMIKYFITKDKKKLESAISILHNIKSLEYEAIDILLKSIIV